MKNKCLITACIIIVISALMFLPAAAAAQEKSFYKGNALYEEGRYDLAIKEYSQLLAQGIESGNLYFNIGNC
ncbi:MAG: hypothetical protein AB1499_11905, partial [Nitrospirota bacterium]